MMMKAKDKAKSFCIQHDPFFPLSSLSSYSHFYVPSIHLTHSLFSFFLSVVSVSIMTVSTPAAEITTLSSQSSPNVPLTTSNSSKNIHSATSPSSSLSTGGEELDVTTMPSAHDDSLKVLPLDENKTNSLNDKYDSTVTSSAAASAEATQSPVTVNSFDTKIKQENDGSDNQAPQTLPVTFDDEKNEKNHSGEMTMGSLPGKEGRAINFPLEISSNNQNTSTTPAHMQINFVTTSTEKTHVMSFFDLSDVSMDHDGGNSKDENDDDGDDVDENVKGKKKATAAGKEKVDKIDGEKRIECSYNGTSYKVRLLSY